MERRRFVARLATAGAVGATGCLGGEEEDEEEDTVVPDTDQQSQQTEQETPEGNETEEEEEQRPKLVNITTSRLNRNAEGTDVESVSVTGRIRNTAEVKIPYMEARVNFLDSDGNTVGKGREIRSDLASDNSWEFEVQYQKLGTEAARVSDYNVTVFVDRAELPDS